MKIDIKQLRLGNILQRCEGGLVYVTALTTYIDNTYRAQIAVCELGKNKGQEYYGVEDEIVDFVRLSVEVLMKCGFKNQGNFSYNSGITGNPLINDDTILFELADTRLYLTNNTFHYCVYLGSDEYGDVIEIIKTTYLHELQNIHHALTGKELKISV